MKYTKEARTGNTTYPNAMQSKKHYYEKINYHFSEHCFNNWLYKMET